MTSSTAPSRPTALVDDETATVPSATAATRTFYQRADALFRCAVECCRQHERVARLGQLDALEAEQRAARSLVAICDEALGELAGAYEKSARERPAGDDACWHAANGLWLASREYARRQEASARAARRIGDRGDHSSARLTELALDYDLEASALLLLKQATDTYRKARPEAA